MNKIVTEEQPLFTVDPETSFESALAHTSSLLHGASATAQQAGDLAFVARELAPAGLRSGPKRWERCVLQREQAPSPHKAPQIMIRPMAPDV
ncbi:hypothetical protein [Pseudomonas sp. S2.OTC.A_B10]|uniref:hypothetical protein n=1 Tax=Pseudomonas sp. S2.OTC.A_B10 TaxID=3237018 RepID=UPI003CFAB2EC